MRMQVSDRVTELLRQEREQDAVRLLQTYFAPRPEGRYSGAYFERLGGGGDRPEVADTFTADDLVAVSLLAVDIGGDAALDLLVTRRDRLGALLREIPRDVALADLTADEVGDGWTVRPLYRELMSIGGLGETSVTKLIARKRPHLVPILDSVVADELGVVKGRYWRPLHEWLVADDRRMHRRLESLRETAGIGADISVLRVFDVLVWMVGKGYDRQG